MLSSTDDQTTAVAIINLAHSLKLRVIGEGVETEAQKVFLRPHGCDELQGYLLAPPLPAMQATRLLAGRASPTFVAVEPVALAG